MHFVPFISDTNKEGDIMTKDWVCGGTLGYELSHYKYKKVKAQ